MASKVTKEPGKKAGSNKTNPANSTEDTSTTNTNPSSGPAEGSSGGTNQFPFSQLEKLLTCPICLDRYKQPKLLPCQHTYCLECLENMADYYRRIVKCAECRTENILPYKGVETFPNNLTILSFLELPSVIAVEEMKSGNNNLLLLQQKNNLREIEQRQQQQRNSLSYASSSSTATAVGSQQSQQQTQQQYRFIKLETCPICAENAELVRCLHCDRKVCTECKDSHTEQLQREVVRLLTNTQKNVPKLEETIQVIEQKLANMKNNFNFVKNEIKMEIERCIRELNNRERVLLEEVDNLMESEIRKMTERQGTLNAEKDEIELYCHQVATRFHSSTSYPNDLPLPSISSPRLNVPVISDRSTSSSPDINQTEATTKDTTPLGPEDETSDESVDNVAAGTTTTSTAVPGEAASTSPEALNNGGTGTEQPITEEELVGLKLQIATYLEHIRDINVEAVESYKRMKFIADNNMLRSNILTFGELHVRSVVHSGSKSDVPTGSTLGYRSPSLDDETAGNLDDTATAAASSGRRGLGSSSSKASERSGSGARNVNSRFLPSSRTRYEPTSSYDYSSTPSTRRTGTQGTSGSSSNAGQNEDIFSGYLGNEVPNAPTSSHSSKSWRTDSNGYAANIFNAANILNQGPSKFNELDSNRFNYVSRVKPTPAGNKKVYPSQIFSMGNLVRSKTSLNLKCPQDSYNNVCVQHNMEGHRLRDYGISKEPNIEGHRLRDYGISKEPNIEDAIVEENSSRYLQKYGRRHTMNLNDNLYNKEDFQGIINNTPSHNNQDSNGRVANRTGLPQKSDQEMLPQISNKNRTTKPSHDNLIHNKNGTVEYASDSLLRTVNEDDTLDCANKNVNGISNSNSPKKHQAYHRSKTDYNIEDESPKVEPQGDHWWKAWLIDDGEVKTRAEKRNEEMRVCKVNNCVEPSLNGANKNNRYGIVNNGGLDKRSGMIKRFPSMSKMAPASSVEYLQNPPIKLRMEQRRRQLNGSEQNSKGTGGGGVQLLPYTSERRASVNKSKILIQIPEVSTSGNKGPSKMREGSQSRHKPVDIISFESDDQGGNNFSCNISHPTIKDGELKYGKSEGKGGGEIIPSKEPSARSNKGTLESSFIDVDDAAKLAESIRNKFNTLQRFKRRNELLLNLASVSVEPLDGNTAVPAKYVPIRERIQKLKEQVIAIPINYDIKHHNYESRPSCSRNEEDNMQESGPGLVTRQNGAPHGAGVNEITHQVKHLISQLKDDDKKKWSGNKEKQSTKSQQIPLSESNFHESYQMNPFVGNDSTKLKKKLTAIESRELFERIFETELRAYIDQIQNLGTDELSTPPEQPDIYDTAGESVEGEIERTNGVVNKGHISNEEETSVESDEIRTDNECPDKSSYKEVNNLNRNSPDGGKDEGTTTNRIAHSILVKHEPKSSHFSDCSSKFCDQELEFYDADGNDELELDHHKLGLISTYHLADKTALVQNRTSNKGGGGGGIKKGGSVVDAVSASLQIRINPTPSKKHDTTVTNGNRDGPFLKFPIGIALSDYNGSDTLLIAQRNSEGIASMNLCKSWDQKRFCFTDRGIRIQVGSVGHHVPEKFYQPCDLAIGTAGQMAVCDRGSNKVLCLDRDAGFTRILGTGEKGRFNGQFDGPTGVTLDSMGFIYVCDGGNKRIQVFSGDGIYVGKWGTGHLVDPKRVYHAPNQSIIYVSDVGDNTVKLFDRNGIKIRTVSGIYKDCGGKKGAVKVAREFGPSKGLVVGREKFNYPTSFSPFNGYNSSINGGQDNVVLLDSGNWRAIILSPDGQVIETHSLISPFDARGDGVEGTLDSCLSLPSNIKFLSSPSNANNRNDYADDTPRFIVTDIINNKLMIL